MSRFSCIPKSAISVIDAEMPLTAQKLGQALDVLTTNLGLIREQAAEAPLPFPKLVSADIVKPNTLTPDHALSA
jgi:hypothetical protein